MFVVYVLSSGNNASGNRGDFGFIDKVSLDKVCIVRNI